MSEWHETAISVSTVGLTGMARKTVAGCVERMSRLYEQGAGAIRIGQYERRGLHLSASGEHLAGGGQKSLRKLS
jgi:hypothetical protein